MTLPIQQTRKAYGNNHHIGGTPSASSSAPPPSSHNPPTTFDLLENLLKEAKSSFDDGEVELWQSCAALTEEQEQSLRSQAKELGYRLRFATFVGFDSIVTIGIDAVHDTLTKLMHEAISDGLRGAGARKKVLGRLSTTFVSGPVRAQADASFVTVAVDGEVVQEDVVQVVEVANSQSRKDVMGKVEKWEKFDTLLSIVIGFVNYHELSKGVTVTWEVYARGSGVEKLKEVADARVVWDADHQASLHLPLAFFLPGEDSDAKIQCGSDLVELEFGIIVVKEGKRRSELKQRRDQQKKAKARTKAKKKTKKKKV